MTYDELSTRQLVGMLWWMLPQYRDRDAIICDGSIRSGKTLSMSVGFIMWLCDTFENEAFAMCGKTIESLRRNVVTHLADWLPSTYAITERRNENKLIVTHEGKTNTVHLFGGRDESSYQLIQGMTLAGVLFDEVALMPRSFVEQAIARCSVSGSRFWFNCNPASPQHWFFIEWVQKAAEKNAVHLHFTMNDNLSLAPEIRRRYESLYSGVFYDRYIRGLWVLAEGVIYPEHKAAIVETVPRDYTRYVVAMDYGIQNPTAMLLIGECGGVWYVIREFYHSGRDTNQQKTDAEYYDDLCELVGDDPADTLIIDPSASSFIALVKKRGRFKVRKANNDVLDGIQHVAGMLKDEALKVNDCCTNLIREFGLYSWDTKGDKDKPIKENDHALDALRYFVNTSKAWQQREKYTPLLERRGGRF